MTEERRLTAIMFTDVCGFSRIMGEDERRALRVVEMANGCVESGTQVYGGRIIKKLGDGLLVEFTSAVNAVRCAVDVQRAVADYNAGVQESERFELRIGIHVGDVVVAGGDIMGDGVNVASRIQPLAEPGGICISRDVFDLINNKLGIETVYLGPHELKNIARQIDIYKVLIDAVSQSGKTVVRLKHGTAGRKRLWLWIAAAVLLVLAALAVVSQVSGAAFKKKAKAAYESVSAAAIEQDKNGNPAAALKTLESFPAKFRSTEWQVRIDELMQKVGRNLEKKNVMDRQMAFVKALDRDEEAAAMRMIDPEALKRVDKSKVWGGFRLIAGLLKLAGVGGGNFRVDEVFLSDDGLSAVVNMKFLKKNQGGPGETWEKVQPMKWRKLNSEWFLVIDTPSPGPDEGPRRPKPPLDRPLERRPER